MQTFSLHESHDQQPGSEMLEETTVLCIGSGRLQHEQLVLATLQLYSKFPHLHFGHQGINNYGLYHVSLSVDNAYIRCMLYTSEN